MKSTITLKAIAILIGAATLTFAPVHAQASAPKSTTTSGDSAAVAKDWIARTSDNVCGLKDLNQLSNPAQVDFEALLAATPEMKELKDKKISPSSPEGIRLANAAADRVTKACETVRANLGHCSVWKQIKHRDGRAITDITDQVKAQF